MGGLFGVACVNEGRFVGVALVKVRGLEGVAGV